MNQNEPTPQESLAMLDQAVAQLTVNRETHVRLQQALQVLTAAVEPKKEK